jgi:hypothetical protein
VMIEGFAVLAAPIYVDLVYLTVLWKKC